MKILLTRTDKLGDVVLALPAIEYLKRYRPTWQVHAMVAPGTIPLVENDPNLDAIWSYTDADLPALLPRLAAEQYAAAILLYYHRPLAAALWRLKVPQRVGPWSKLSSWFLLNRGVWLGKSRSKRHERDHNVKLVQRLVGKGGEISDPQIHLTAGQLEISQHFLREEAVETENVVFVHPGSGGSALNWSPASYAAVANRLAAQAGCRVFVTGGPQDEEAITAMSVLLVPDVKVIADRYGLREFLGVLSAGDLLIGPSTGPLHMAAALGLAVVGLYPPIASQSIQRWGPLGPWSRALAPGVNCPGRLVCFGERCRHYNCMNSIAENDVAAAAASLLAERRGIRRGERGEAAQGAPRGIQSEARH